MNTWSLTIVLECNLFLTSVEYRKRVFCEGLALLGIIGTARNRVIKNISEIAEKASK